MGAEFGDFAGSERAARFVELLTAHQRKLYSYICTLMLGDPAANDVLQDTNVDLWARAGDYDFSRPFLPWAFGFARQRVLAYRKSRSRSRLVISDAAMARIESECARLAGDADARLVALKQCLAKLDARQAHLIHERYDAKTSVKTLAARLGETAHNVASRLHRVRKSLARCIELTLAREEHA